MNAAVAVAYNKDKLGRQTELEREKCIATAAATVLSVCGGRTKKWVGRPTDAARARGMPPFCAG